MRGGGELLHYDWYRNSRFGPYDIIPDLLSATTYGHDAVGGALDLHKCSITKTLDFINKRSSN